MESLFYSVALIGSCEWATNAAAGYAIDGKPAGTVSRSSYDPMAQERVPFSPKGSSKQLLLGSIHRIRTMELSSRIGAKRCSIAAVNRIYLWSIFILCLV